MASLSSKTSLLSRSCFLVSSQPKGSCLALYVNERWKRRLPEVFNMYERDFWAEIWAARHAPRHAALSKEVNIKTEVVEWWRSTSLPFNSCPNWVPDESWPPLPGCCVRWQVSHPVTGEKDCLWGEPAAEGGACAELVTATKFPALFILVWQVVMELIVQ